MVKQYMLSKILDAITWDVPGTYVERTCNVPGTYLDHTWIIPGTCLDRTWNIRGSSLDHTWNIRGELVGNASANLIGSYKQITATNVKNTTSSRAPQAK